jgi:hypothetical protein
MVKLIPRCMHTSPFSPKEPITASCSLQSILAAL